MVSPPADFNWDSLSEASTMINDWANRTFPGRSPRASLRKLVEEEIPELLTHLKVQGPEGIAGEWADTMILLLDLARIWKLDPARAIEDKMRINNNRMWRKDEETGFYNHVKIEQRVDQSGADAARAIHGAAKQEIGRPSSMVQEVDAPGRESGPSGPAVVGDVNGARPTCRCPGVCLC